MVNKDYVIKDNFLPNNLYINLKNFIHGPTINWYFRKTETDNTINSNGYYTFCWYNYFKPDHPSFDALILPILKMLKCRAPIQVRANTTFPSNLPTGWHVDYPYPEAKTAILYFSSHEDAPTLLKLNKKVVPIDAIENRLLMFSSIIEHKAVYSKNYQRRIVLNLNWF